MCLQLWINEKTGALTPCGNCAECVARKISAWSCRLTNEEKYCESALFLTLTYSTDFVPITPKGFMTLDKRDVQLFFKNLRKAQFGSKKGNIKYYAAGEYGGRTNRPHWHIILFNARVELLQPAWDKGQIHYGTVTPASIGYSLKYISKPKKFPKHSNDDRLRECALMSKN